MFRASLVRYAKNALRNIDKTKRIFGFFWHSGPILVTIVVKNTVTFPHLNENLTKTLGTGAKLARHRRAQTVLTTKDKSRLSHHNNKRSSRSVQEFMNHVGKEYEQTSVYLAHFDLTTFCRLLNSSIGCCNV